jgi:hypothetical protein
VVAKTHKYMYPLYIGTWLVIRHPTTGATGAIGVTHISTQTLHMWYTKLFNQISW